MSNHFSNQPILRDFDRFLTYICEGSAIQLTNDKAMLKGPDLMALNEQMLSFKSEMVTGKNHQNVFTLLNTFFFIAQKAGLIYVLQNGKNQLAFREKAIRAYDAMSDDEKYFSLLEGFWCWVDWDYAYDCRSFWSHDFYEKLAAMPVGKKITLADRNLKRNGEMNSPAYPFFAEVLSAFGLWELTWDDALAKRPAKYYFPYKDITLMQLGSVIMPILLIERPRYLWSNFHDFEFWDNEEYEDEEENIIKTKGNFEDAFKPFFEGLTVETRLFQREKTFVAGTYYFKVALDKKLYRVIAIDGNETFDDLHLAIQNAFDFYNDHLYAFFMDGRRWSRNGETYWSPENGDGISADEVKIGEGQLYEGKSFLYLFDFGSEWHFKVTVQAINTDEKPPKEAIIVESLGNNPEQYEDYDNEND